MAQFYAFFDTKQNALLADTCNFSREGGPQIFYTKSHNTILLQHSLNDAGRLLQNLRDNYECEDLVDNISIISIHDHELKFIKELFIR